MLIAGIIMLVLAFAALWVFVADNCDSITLIMVALWLAVIGGVLIWAGGCGFTRSLNRLSDTNIKVISACTNQDSVIIVGVMPDNQVRVFDYPVSQGAVESGKYYHVVPKNEGSLDMKLVPFDTSN